jgi:hypothetical protein
MSIMEREDSKCERVQWAISEAMDGGVEVPMEAKQHAWECGECGRFLAAWSGGRGSVLGEPVPEADEMLRARVLALPGSGSAWVRVRGYLSAAAAVVVLGSGVYFLVEVRPTGEHAGARRAAAERELAAIRRDVREGVAALRVPAGALQRVLRR